MTPRLNIFIAAIVVLIGFPAYWYWFDNRPGDVATKPLDLATIRAMADEASERESGPAAAQYEALGYRWRMRGTLAAGSGVRFEKQFLVSYRLTYADDTSIMIDAGVAPDQAGEANFSAYDSRAWPRVESALREARFVIPLGSGLPHIGGLDALSAQDSTWAAKRAEPDLSPSARARKAAGDPYPIAPGIVVIPTAERAPNSQMVYVHFQDGRELLFLGTLSQTARNWRDLRAPSRYLTDIVRTGDRNEYFAWLETVQKWKAEQPDLKLVSLARVPQDAGISRYFSAPTRAQKTLDIAHAFR